MKQEPEEKREPRFYGEVTERSHKNMSRIRGKDTSIEVALLKALWVKGYRFRKNYKKLPGSPNMALTKHKIAIFCDSEFFMGKIGMCSERNLKPPRISDYWIERNIERDKEKDLLFQAAGWTVIYFWGKDIEKYTEECIAVIEEAIFNLKMP